MSLKKISLVALATLVICSGFALPCHAQNTFKRHRPLRWLGQGFSDGYHRHNPGYDTSYYNPYSAHNSNLISRSPEYLAVRAQHLNQQPTRQFFNGVPFSVYAAPPQLNSGLQTMPSQQFQGSFSPSVGSGLDDETDDAAATDGSGRYDENEDEDDDNDFREDDNDFRDDDSVEMDEEDNDFRDDDDSVEMDEEDLDVEGLDDRDEDVDTSNLGGLSDLEDSLSFDFE